MAQENEASVEEILESIKKVIARDNRAGAIQTRQQRIKDIDQAEAPAFGPPAMPQLDEEESDEILDLAEMEFVEDESGFAVEDGSELGEELEHDLEEDLDASDTSEDEDEIDHGADDIDPQLTTESVRGAMRENLDALALLAEPSAPPQIVRSGETSLEGLTREMLRPMLAEWLDANLPGIVEKLVRAEIAKIAGKRR